MKPSPNNLRTIIRALSVVAIAAIVARGSASAATVIVTVAPSQQHVFQPSSVTIQPGDTVKWVWDEDNHTVTSGNTDDDIPKADGLFNSGNKTRGSEFSFTFPSAGTFDYYCVFHHGMGMDGSVKVVAATSTAAAQPLNISTRLSVQTDENVMIGGLIVTGTVPKRVIIRAIGPSLVTAGIQEFLADPTLELHDASTTLATNDNWKTRSDGSSQQAEIEATTVPPTNNLESAIVATLPANNASYTVIVSGKNRGTGVGVVEVYDLDQPADARLANISTRGLVQTGTNVMIGGFILGGGTGNMNVIVRAIGPSLNQAVNGALADPTLELRNGNGALLVSNDNWKTRSDGSSQQSQVEATGVPPTNELESAIVATLPPGAFTAIVAGKSDSGGIALVEVYRLP
jgi:plastocyanin